MHKLVAAFDSLNASTTTMDYAVYLSKHFNMHIIAALLSDIAYDGKLENGYDQPYSDDWTGTTTYRKKEIAVHQAMVAELKNKFDAAGVHYNFHHNQSIAVQALIEESAFADMILVNGNENFSATDVSVPSYFLRTLLADAHCPVLVVPNEFHRVEKFILTYDGTPSSMYAIKLFSYMFSLEASQQVELVMVSDDEHTNHFPEQNLLAELLKKKYPAVHMSILKHRHTTDTLLDYLQSQQLHCMAVMGAYHRSAISRWLHQSIADTMIAEAEMPIFIAHQ